MSGKPIAAGVVLWLAWLLLAPRPGAVALEVAEVFGPEMVLQRGVPVPVWGTGAAGEEVSVAFAGRQKTTSADQWGHWEVVLEPMPARAKGQELTIQGAEDSISFENVRVGEVWLVIHHRLPRQYAGEGPVPSPHLRIRSFDGGRELFSLQPQRAFGHNSPWGPDKRQRADMLSIAFANRLVAAMEVPVGIVSVHVGDLQATIPPPGFAAVEGLKDIAQEVETWNPHTPRGKAAYARWWREMQQWKRSLEAELERGGAETPRQPPLVPGPLPDDPMQPCVVFNRQLHPLVPFAFRGVLHVHEDATQDDPPCTLDPRYAAKMRALVAGLRAVFRRADLAFAFTQRNQPSLYHRHTLGEMLDFAAWPAHRDRQRRVLPFAHTGMVVTLDVENDPGAVGERFAGWALAEAYGEEGPVSGPIYRSLRVEGDRVIVEFDHAGRGLMAARFPEVGAPLAEEPGAQVRFFAVAGEDRIFHRAFARIEGRSVVVHSPKVARPVAVRYAWHFDPRGMDLYNRAGLPASPFRSDDWPVGDLEQAVEQLGEKSTEGLVAMLGYPTMLHSQAAVQALAARGEAEALPVATRLLKSDDADQRCGALRTLGWLYWMGPVGRGSTYYSQKPQEPTPAIDRAIELIAKGTDDDDPLVRRCAAEALGLIGVENERVFELVRGLAVDTDPLVRTAAMRLSKFRLKTHAHNTALAYALLEERPFGDRSSAALAGMQLNHYRVAGPIDTAFVARYLRQIEPGQGGPVVSHLGDLLRRIKLPDGSPALNDPQVLPAVLHLYSIGYRNYMLYGVDSWIRKPRNLPVFRAEIQRWQREIERLRRERPPGWQDRVGRYEDAIQGLGELVARIEQEKR